MANTMVTLLAHFMMEADARQVESFLLPQMLNPDTIVPQEFSSYASPNAAHFEYFPFGFGADWVNTASTDPKRVTWKAGTAARYKAITTHFRTWWLAVHTNAARLAKRLKAIIESACVRVTDPCTDEGRSVARNVLYAELHALAEALELKAASDIATAAIEAGGTLTADITATLNVAGMYRRVSLILAPEAYSSRGAVVDVLLVRDA